MQSDKLYHYKAALVRVIDADTVVLTVDMGFYIHRSARSYRLLGIDCPERRTQAGITAKAALEEYLDGKSLIVRTKKADSFGRFLCDLWADGENVQQWLLDNGYGVVR